VNCPKCRRALNAKKAGTDGHLGLFMMLHLRCSTRGGAVKHHPPQLQTPKNPNPAYKKRKEKCTMWVICFVKLFIYFFNFFLDYSVKFYRFLGCLSFFFVVYYHHGYYFNLPGKEYNWGVVSLLVVNENSFVQRWVLARLVSRFILIGTISMVGNTCNYVTAWDGEDLRERIQVTGLINILFLWVCVWVKRTFVVWGAETIIIHRGRKK